VSNEYIKSGTLNLIIGLPSSGKSTVLKNSGLPEDVVLSSDEIRKSFFGETKYFNGEREYTSPNHFADNVVFDILKKILEERMKNHLTTVLDVASMVSKKDRSEVKKIAQRHGVDVQEWYFKKDVDNSIYHNNQREYYVPEGSIVSFGEKYNMEDLDDNAKEINIKTRFELIVNPDNVLPHGKYDVVGDIHGLYSDFCVVLKELGYEKDSRGVFIHPEGRNLLLLGDFLDRGQENMEMLDFVYKQTMLTDDKVILGNHENKLINFLNFYKNGKGKVITPSPAASLTASDFLKLKEEERNKFEKMLRELPYYYVSDDMAFVHANIEHFNPLTSPSSYLMYGDMRKSASFKESAKHNQDRNYARIFDSGDNKYYLVRGHIPSQSEDQNVVLSLENRQAFNGHISVAKLEDLRESIDNGLGVNNPALVHNFKTQSGFDFDVFKRKELGLFAKIKRLEKENLARRDSSENGLLSVFKYKKDVFFKRKWESNSDLLSCRGIVFDFAGRIVQYPFDKVFNYNEPNESGKRTGLDIDVEKSFVEVEKLNGFFGAITRDPFKDDLLMSTTGSLTSPFVTYIKDMVKKDGVYGDLMKYTSKNPNVTLMFEVIHPEDPHIIDYSEDEKGLYLIGAREKYEGSPLYTEDKLDKIAEEVGLRRPSWKVSKLKDILRDNKTSKKEGVMVRDLETGETFLKLKSPHYLLVKFMGRLSDKKAKHMFGNAKSFKKNIDEEFFDIVDGLVERTNLNDFLEMSESDRKDLVRKIIDDQTKLSKEGRIKKRKPK